MFVMVVVVVVLLHASQYMYMHSLVLGMVIYGSNNTFLEIHIFTNKLYIYIYIHRQVHLNTNHPKPTALARWYWISLLMRRVPRTPSL